MGQVKLGCKFIEAPPPYPEDEDATRPLLPTINFGDTKYELNISTEVSQTNAIAQIRRWVETLPEILPDQKDGITEASNPTIT